MIPDLYKDIKIQLYERATSPLLGSFVISWCLWNYKLLLVIFSSGTAFEKIARIEFILYPNFFWDGAKVGLIYPLLTTAFFIFLFPYPARFVFWVTRYQQMKTKEIQQKIEDETPLTQEESREIRSSLRSIVQRHDVEIGEKDKEIINLEATIKELKKEYNLGINVAEKNLGEIKEKLKFYVHDKNPQQKQIDAGDSRHLSVDDSAKTLDKYQTQPNIEFGGEIYTHEEALVMQLLSIKPMTQNELNLFIKNHDETTGTINRLTQDRFIIVVEGIYEITPIGRSFVDNIFP